MPADILFNGPISNDAVQAFALLADRGDLTGSGNKIDEELAADYLRLNRTSSPYKGKFEDAGIKAASAPQGFFAYNYGALGIHRFDNWMVTLKGYNTDVWCSEIYTKDNRYGRYQSYGSVQILASGRPSIILPVVLSKTVGTGTVYREQQRYIFR